MLKKILIITVFGTSCFSFGQSLVQSINAGSVISNQAMISVGEIMVTPASNNQSSSGILGVLSQNNTLSKAPFELHKGMTVFPNPTISVLHFETIENIAQEKVRILDMQGKLIFEKQIDNKSINLESLNSGVYLIQFENPNYKSFKIIKQ